MPKRNTATAKANNNIRSSATMGNTESDIKAAVDSHLTSVTEKEDTTTTKSELDHSSHSDSTEIETIELAETQPGNDVVSINSISDNNTDKETKQENNSTKIPEVVEKTVQEVPERVQPGTKVFSGKRSWLAIMFYRIFKNPTPTLDRMVKFISSSSGQDKVWMFVQYFTKVLRYLFAMRRRHGLAKRVGTLSGIISDYRIMSRLTDLVPMFQYLRYVEQNPSQSRTLQNTDRLMNLLLLCYYPLEHIYWLGAHNIIAISESEVESSGIWSCRFWAAWVVVQFFHLYKERQILKARKRACFEKTDMDATDLQKELETIEQANKDWYIQLIINASYFPLTIHWSLRHSTFPDVLVGVFGTIAAAAQAYTKWKSL
ncbi:hypothetical protein H4219_000312 [Mycoemilia scoparia]|uniref:Peroxisomal biogenesis factor 11 n=1 Tax=Mycoemilia scoparia TaxID=417184 RepID=A0A9W8A8W4_9FUNG|nr:hypothetical protein H4219_000312 [Mycoemilia scoparia]